jgi:NAD-dependent deacetylase
MAMSEPMDQAVGYVAGARRVAVLTGAGVSAESGLPTFRGMGGLWENHPIEDVATPEGFDRNPQLVWRFYNARRHGLRRVRPNPAHQAIAELERLAPEFTLVTQNVDRLHQAAGSRRVLELHGDLWTVRCTQCHQSFDKTGIELPELPSCERCGGMLRPGVVWFGESLPDDVWQAAHAAIASCDCLLVVGTSAQVQPAASLAWIARRAGARVIEVNLEPTPAEDIASVGLYGPAGQLLAELVRRVKEMQSS